MVVLGVGAVSYQRGTPVGKERDLCVCEESVAECIGHVDLCRGTSLIRNNHPPRITKGPYA